MKKIQVLLFIVFISLCFTSCNKSDRKENTSMQSKNINQSDYQAESPKKSLVIEANGKKLYASFEDNSSAEELAKRLSSSSISVNMNDYGDFEKVGSLPWDLPKNDSRITTQPGDIILYQGNQITIYYGTNTWNFTKLAKINNISREELLDVLGKNNVVVKFYVEQNE